VVPGKPQKADCENGEPVGTGTAGARPLTEGVPIVPCRRDGGVRRLRVVAPS
jgi:hypothetical protein